MQIRRSLPRQDKISAQLHTTMQLHPIPIIWLKGMCAGRQPKNPSSHTEFPLHDEKERLNLTSIKLTIIGAQAWAEVSGPLTSGMVGLPVTIEYDEAWDGLTKNLVCRCSPWGSDQGEVRTILNVDQTAVVAHEVMQAGQYLHLGVEGFREDGTLVIPTTWARCEEVIHYGANVDADPSADPTLPMWNQLQAQIEQINRDGITQEKLDEINGCVEAAAHSATRAERAMDNSIASSNFATRSMNSAAEFANQAEKSEKNAQTYASSAANIANGALQAQRAAEAAAERAVAAADSVQTSYELPIGGEELGGVKNGGNVRINADGTMDAPAANVSGEEIAGAVAGWLEAHPEATTVVADGSITVEKTTFIEPVSDNLIDMSKVVKGYQGASGVPAGGSMPNTSLGCTTDYIQVEAGSTYTSSPDHGTSGIWTSWFYDAGKNPLAAVSSRTFTVPDGAAYVRLSYALNTDISTLRLGLYRGANPMVHTQGTQRYNLDPLLSAAIKAVHDSNSVFKVTAKNLYKPAADGTIDSATGKFTLTGGSLNISDYIEVTPGIYYASNCFGAPAYSAAYDKNRGYISAFSDAVEWGADVYYDGGFYRVFKVIDPNVRYIVNGSSKSLSTPIKTPFIVRGNAIPDSLEGIDISTESVAYIEAAKKLLGITGNDLVGLTWAVLGDSITAASGVERSYHSIIAQKLGLTAINYGYNGSWISYTDAMPEGNEMCVRYATMTEDADIITCLGGINDINNNAALGQMGDTENTTFYGAMDLLIRGLLGKYPGKRIGFITPPRYGDGAREQPYIDAIHAVCEKYAVPVLDLYREGMASTATAELSATYFKDGLHPNELGHDVIARKVEAFLRRL